MKTNDTFLSFQILILFRILNRIQLKIFISKTNVLILAQAMFAKESKKANTILQRKDYKKIKKSKRYNQTQSMSKIGAN